MVCTQLSSLEHRTKSSQTEACRWKAAEGVPIELEMTDDLQKKKQHIWLHLQKPLCRRASSLFTVSFSPWKSWSTQGLVKSFCSRPEVYVTLEPWSIGKLLKAHKGAQKKDMSFFLGGGNFIFFFFTGSPWWNTDGQIERKSNTRRGGYSADDLKLLQALFRLPSRNMQRRAQWSLVPLGAVAVVFVMLRLVQTLREWLGDGRCRSKQK